MTNRDDRKLTRRRIIQATAAGAAAAWLPAAGAERNATGQRSAPNREGGRMAPTFANPKIQGEFAAETLMSHVRAYDALGVHRSGTDGDVATAQWMAERLGSLGFDVDDQSFVVQQVEPRDVGVTLADGSVVAGFPQWPVTPTAGRNVSARLVAYSPFLPPARMRGAIVVIDFPHRRPSAFMTPAYRDPVMAALAAGAAAVVGITQGPTGELIALNAPPDLAPFPAPVLLVAPKDATPLQRAAALEERATVRLEVEGPVQRTACNVVGRLTRPGRPLMVVTTPQSGGRQIRRERGPGIATWRALAAWAAVEPRASFVFAATSGHELDNHGAHRFLAAAAPAPGDVAVWAHLGAGFAARDWHEVGRHRLLPLPSADPQRFLAGTPDLVPILQHTFAGLPGLEAVYTANVDNTAGELSEVLRAGYTRVFGAFGAHRYHHAEADRPSATSGAILQAAAYGFVAALQEILRHHEVQSP